MLWPTKDTHIAAIIPYMFILLFICFLTLKKRDIINIVHNKKYLLLCKRSLLLLAFKKARLLNSPKIIHLTPPHLSDAHIKKHVACIRAHRERLFNTSFEHKNSKFIFHNYGQGGAGWTFLFGCVQKSIQQFLAQRALNPLLKNEPICVVGAGCYGLLTAIFLADLGMHVRIVCSDLFPESSDKAAGFFFPRPRKSSTPQEAATFLACGTESYKEYTHIAQGTHPLFRKGAAILPAYFGLDIDPGFAPYIEQGLLKNPERVLIDFNNGKQYPAMAYQTVWIQALDLMEEFHRNIAERHINIQKITITDFKELPERIIFNCSGLGAKALTQDSRLVPVQGHLIQLQNQPASLNYLINFKMVQQSLRNTPRDELIYFAPKNGGILGITFIRGCGDEAANSYEFERLIERCRNFF